ncbi:MAG TPA: hypothetical protein VHW60_24800 [Caulobacteraceae bacterium]|nr:hypothetical protein [Caulobacteraceae bacterium]
MTDSLSSQIDALNTRVNELQKALPVLASPTATPDQRNLALAATAASATAYNNIAKNALVTRLRVLPSLKDNFTAAGAIAAPATAAPAGP